MTCIKTYLSPNAEPNIVLIIESVRISIKIVFTIIINNNKYFFELTYFKPVVLRFVMQ